MKFRDFSKWKISVKLCVTRDKVLTVIRKMGYTYMFRVNNTFIISKEKVLYSETRNHSADKSVLAFSTTQQFINMLAKIL